MTRTPIPNCPQSETPIRDRAWTDVEPRTDAVWTCKIGSMGSVQLPHGADAPMRAARKGERHE